VQVRKKVKMVARKRIKPEVTVQIYSDTPKTVKALVFPKYQSGASFGLTLGKTNLKGCTKEEKEAYGLAKAMEKALQHSSMEMVVYHDQTSNLDKYFFKKLEVESDFQEKSLKQARIFAYNRKIRFKKKKEG
jgi:hypothetical protein